MGFFRKKVITFFMNERCNMMCIYCTIHAEDKKNKDKDRSKVIDLDFAKCGIDDYFSNGFFAPDEKKGIRIFANGEPTLEFERMAEIVAYAHQKAGNNLFVEMQTNGLFKEEIAHWIKENVDLVWFSLDGLEDLQNMQRPTQTGEPSFAAIDRNIKIVSTSTRTKIGLRPTISDYNIDRQIQLIDYALENGIAAVCADPWGNMVKKKKGQPELKQFADKFLEAWKYAREKNFFYGTEFTVNFDEEVEIYCRSCLPAPQFTPDGYVSSCDMVNNKEGFLPNFFPELIFGYYNKEEKKIEYNQEHLEKIKSRNIYNLKDCQGCEALKHCAGGCIGIAIASSLDFYGKNNDYCAITKYLFKRMPELINTGYNPDIPIHP
jgi:radical SAM protein with 4Fe4S-binding SPASM domain